MHLRTAIHQTETAIGSRLTLVNKRHNNKFDKNISKIKNTSSSHHITQKCVQHTIYNFFFIKVFAYCRDCCIIWTRSILLTTLTKMISKQNLECFNRDY